MGYREADAKRANTREVIAEHSSKEAENGENVLTVVNPAEWHGKPVPVREWYVEELIPMRQVTIVNGDGGVGKSLLTLQLAAAGAMAVDTLEMNPRAGRTLYVGAEDEAEEFHRRLLDIARSHGRTLADLAGFCLIPLADRDALLAVPDKSGKMLGTPLMQSIVDRACEWQPKLIVFDTAADLFGGDEIKRGQVRQFIGMLRQLAISVNCAVILLAHPSVQGIQTGTGSSGSTAWNNSVRSRLYLTRPEAKDADTDLRILKTMKANYGTTGGEIRLRWKDGAFVLDDGKPQLGSQLLAAKAERVFKEVLSLFNRTGQNVSDVTGTSYAPAKMAKHPAAEGMSKKALADAMQRLIDSGDVRIIMEGPPSRQRKRLILASEDFGPKA
ncbi:AAA domain-containing protein [Rhizobium multihospitium]|uniref:AAA domain-containing protein n=2 Tax=Rhizobium multihospitium TaxID=410764 RepID=A0A1C3WNT4_9HYPH|nr:AAA domain-containing protein [Rhizobium multihospitium]